MHPQIETIFDEAEQRYLKTEELGLINQYVESLPARLDTYQTLRDRELEIMQQVADQLEAMMPQEPTEHLEQSLKHALSMLRYAAMGMLLNDELFVQERLLNWLTKTISIHNTQAVDATLFRLLDQRLAQTLTPIQLGLISPQIVKVQSALLQQSPALAAISN